MDRRSPDTPSDGRRRRTAASALVAIRVAFVLGALFNAPAMQKTAREMPFGAVRGFKLALVDPLAGASRWLLLDRPSRLVAEALGRPDPGPLAVEDVVVTPQPALSGKLRRDRPLPKPYSGHPMHLYIAGDSIAGIPGMALVNLAKKTRLMKPLLDYRISSGLCRPDFFNWPARLREQARAFDPGAVVVMYGANDRQAVETASGRVCELGSPGWKKEYRRRVDQVIAVLFNEGVRRIYRVGQPIMPAAAVSRQMRLVNDVYEAAARKNPGVRYIDAYEVFSKASGGYSQYLRDDAGRLQQVREQDGKHLTYAGGMRLAEVVMAAIRKEWLAGTKRPGKSAASPTRSPGAEPSP